MAISTLPNDTTLSRIREEDDHTRGKLEVHPLTAALAVPFTTYMTVTWQPALLKEQALEYALSRSTVRVLYEDGVLNVLVNKVDTALLYLVNKDRTAPLYLQFFGSKRPFEVAQGILGPQLETMRAWVPLLKGSSHASLKAVGAELEAAVAGADAAVKEKADAESALRVFRTTGERAQAAADYNALRKATYGELGKIKHLHPELPNDFADSFFLHESKRPEEKLTIEQLELKVEELAAQQVEIQEKIAAMKAKQQAEAEEKLEMEQRLADLESKKKERDALDASIRKMQAELRR